MELNLKDIANGAVQELFENELNKILENIKDPNTSLKKARKLTINFTFKPLQDDRDIVSVDINTKSTLAQVEGVATQILIDKDGNRLSAVEFNKNTMKGQQVLEDLSHQELQQDIKEKNIINFKAN